MKPIALILLLLSLALTPLADAASIGTGGGGGGGASAPSGNALFASTANAGPNNSAAETSIIGTGVGSLTTTANYFAAGTPLYVRASGFYSTPAVPSTLAIKIKAGATVVGTVTFTPPANLTNQVFTLEAVVTCRTAGATGTFIMNDVLLTSNATVPDTVSAAQVNTTTVTLDTTGTLAWDITATWGAAQVGQLITGTNFIMFTPGVGIVDPGSSGVLARTALNTVAARTITGTANEIAVADGNGVSANPTLSLPATLALAGKSVTLQDNNLTVQDNADTTKKLALELSGLTTATTRTVTIPDASGTLALTTSNVATATALAANGANCSPGSAPLGVDASGAAETCTNYMEEPAGNGIVARTAANASANRTITGTANEISVTNGDGASGDPTLSLPSTITLTSKSLIIPNSITLPATCTVGQIYLDTDATSGQRLYACQATNTWALQGDGGGGGSIGGTSGPTDNAVIRADGIAGSTIQGSTVTINDSGQLTAPGGIVAGTSGTGVVTMLEGAPAGAATNAGEHNLYFDSADSKLKSHENGGSVVTYHSTANLPAALAANGANCSSGQFPLGVDAGGASENCTALPTTITGTANEVSASAPTGAITLSLPSTLNLSSKTVRVPNSTALPATCTVGDIYDDTDATSGLRLYLCESVNTWAAVGTGGGTGLTSLAGQTANTQTITRGAGIGGTSATNDHSFTVDATELHGLTWGDGVTSASWTWTYNLNAGTDPVITFNNGVVNVSTGALQEAGNDVLTTGSAEISALTAKNTPTTSDLLVIEDAAASNAKKKSTVGEVLAANDARTKTLTNTTLDAEGTGNVLTIPRRIWLPAAGCNNATAGPIWDLPASGAAVAACVTGTNTQKGVLDFADASNLSAQLTYKLPSTWTGAIDANIKWLSATTTGDVVWQVATVCVADAETDDPAFNTASTVTDTTKGTTNQTNDAAITGVTATGCAAGELLHLKLFRDSAHASDTMAGTARLIGVELVIREAL